MEPKMPSLYLPRLCSKTLRTLATPGPSEGSEGVWEFPKMGGSEFL